MGERRGTPAERRRAREKRFRARVVRLRGCFGALTGRERQVLELRAGLGDRGPLTAGQVAQELDIDRSAVTTTQRRALRRLGAARRAGGCGGSGGGGGAGVRGVGGTGALLVGAGDLPRLQPAVLLADNPRLVPASDLDSSRDRDRGDVRGVQASGGDASAEGDAAHSDSSSGGPRLERGGQTLAAAGGDGSVAPLPLAVAVALAFALLAAVTLRRRDGGRAVATSGGAATAGQSPTMAMSAGPAAPVAAAAAGAATAREAEQEEPAEPPTEPTSSTQGEPEPQSDIEDPPGDTAAAPGPPAAAAAAGAAAGARERDRTVVRRRKGGLIGAARGAAGSAGDKLREAARKARERRDG